jgi:hypothetical protein
MWRDVVIIKRVLQDHVVKKGCMEFFSMRDDIHHVAAIYHSDHIDHMVKVSSREGGSKKYASKHAIECAGQDQLEFRGHVETLVGESQHFKHHQTRPPHGAGDTDPQQRISPAPWRDRGLEQTR